MAISVPVGFLWSPTSLPILRHFKRWIFFNFHIFFLGPLSGNPWWWWGENSSTSAVCEIFKRACLAPSPLFTTFQISFLNLSRAHFELQQVVFISPTCRNEMWCCHVIDLPLLCSISPHRTNKGSFYSILLAVYVDMWLSTLPKLAGECRSTCTTST